MPVERRVALALAQDVLRLPPGVSVRDGDEHRCSPPVSLRVGSLSGGPSDHRQGGPAHESVKAGPKVFSPNEWDLT